MYSTNAAGRLDIGGSLGIAWLCMMSDGFTGLTGEIALV